MTFGPTLDALVRRWAEQPTAPVFAALADGLRKRGALAEAADVVAAGLERFPGWTPGVLVGVRLAIAQGDSAWAETALRGILEADPGHPVARDLARSVAPGLLGGGPEPSGGSDLHGTLEADPPAAAEEHEEELAQGEFVTESLAALYHAQGHLDQALTAYRELAARDPGNAALGERAEAILAELLGRQATPLDARQGGGRGVGEWLAAVASARPSPGRQPASFDAFYEPPPAPPAATTDFDAFQRWLKELEA
jgi:tetratricopeptide (TPR) repeat protein